MNCIYCGSGTRMQVQAVISAPGELAHQFSKKNLRSKEVYLMGVLWETADYICIEPNCGRVLDGYGNYVTGLKKRVKELEDTINNPSLKNKEYLLDLASRLRKGLPISGDGYVSIAEVLEATCNLLEK